jgi:hypothetical protein
MTTSTTPKQTSVETDIFGVEPLCCPQCGNTGKDAAFSAATFVLIKEQGLPVLVGDYSQSVSDGSAPDTIDCHLCDYTGPIAEFRVPGRGGEA